MSVAGTVLPKESEPKNRDDQRFPPTEQPYGPWLCQSEKVSVYYARLKPTRWPEHHHRQAELFLTFDDASAEIAWRGKGRRSGKQSVGPHQFCLIPPNLPHECEWKNEADVVAVYIEERLLREHVNGAFRTVVVDDFQVLTRLDACLWSIGGMFRDLCRTSAIQPASFVEGIGTALASRTLEQHFRGTHDGAPSLQKLPGGTLRRMVAYIHAHMRDAITVADLARDAALSVDHFARLVKNTTGSSPLQFLLKCRVEKALDLLRTGDFRVAEAACEVGFYDQSHLDRHCRKFFGFPPKSAMKAAVDVDLSLKIPESSKIPAA
ncbi:MAG TPA: helix-turn-helix domain-containing protein [Opitutaceae bacterium]|nr:helix-turn-helix domain-containing protein [Lacunisphaera sp.]HWA09123.1 helix-turn-helix domain-containing protein [Opitutaceae bacterium]